ncbi:MAG: DNA translocase FtsK [Thermodesulfobacteriota bacterium]
MSRKPAAKPSPIRKEIRGILFLLAAVVLGVSLFSYHPGDPLAWDAGMGVDKTRNLFGPMGAHLSGSLFFALGFSSLWLVAFFTAAALFSFLDRPMPSPALNGASVFFLLISFSGLLALQFPDSVSFREGSVLCGGIVGLHVAGVMKGYLNGFGANVLLGAIFIIALMITTRLSFGRVFSRIYSWAAALGRRVREWTEKRKERKRKNRVRVAKLKSHESKPKRRPTIVPPPEEPRKTPEQESFSFMKIMGSFSLPSLDLLDDPPEQPKGDIARESLEMNARLLEKKLYDFNVEGEVVEILPGPVITMYEFKPAPGIKISKVAGLADDLALVLRASGVRIVAPIPGKAAIGIEIPNNRREPVFLKEILASPAFKSSTHRITIALGKDITGAPMIADLSRMPHLLVAGATGTGKSVCLNAIINSLLFKASPDMVRFVMIDPKRIELSIYQDIPHLLHPVVTQPGEATKALRWAVEEMEYRYGLLSDRGVRDIEAYNRKVMKEKQTPGESESSPVRPLPYIVIVIDELADLMMVSSKDVEDAILRLSQMARAAGIHLIIATQRPSVDVLTGIIKANLPTRISFQVSSKVDSRTILDAIGAEHLLGEGDMLYMPPGVSRLTRIHGAFISETEVKRVTDFLKEQMKPEYDPAILEKVARSDEPGEEELELDEKYEEAVEMVIKSGQASISGLQRKLRVGYNRAARMIEAMERQGVIGPSDGVRPREVYGRREES